MQPNPETRGGFSTHARGGGGGGAVVLVVLVVVGQFFFSFFHTRTHARRRVRTAHAVTEDTFSARKIYGRSDWLHRPPSTILRHCHLQRLMSPSALSNMAVSGIGVGVGG